MSLIGFDTLGFLSPKFNVDNFIATLPPAVAWGLLDSHTFGDEFPKVARVFESGKIVDVRVHIFNGPAIRLQNAEQQDLVHGYTIASFNAAVERKDSGLMRTFRDRVSYYAAIAHSHHIHLKVSPVLENNCTQRAFQILADAVREVSSDIEVVCSPGFVPNWRYGTMESHGLKPLFGPASQVSMDGFSAEDEDCLSFFGHLGLSEVGYLWSRVYNGRLGAGAFVPPSQRKAFPTKEQFEDLAYLVQPVPPPPVLHGHNATPLVKPNLWKTWAEDHGVGDGRANKPMFITNLRSGYLHVVTYDGHEIGQLKYYGPYGATNSGLYRYYSATGSNLTAWQMVQRCRQMSHTDWAYVTDGRTYYGPFLVGRRTGYYR